MSLDTDIAKRLATIMSALIDAAAMRMLRASGSDRESAETTLRDEAVRLSLAATGAAYLEMVVRGEVDLTHANVDAVVHEALVRCGVIVETAQVAS